MFDIWQRQTTQRAVALLVGFVLLLPVWAQADSATTFVGEVVGVYDGDTIEVMHEGRAVKIRLQGIDTPEKGQAYGTAARQFTADLVHRQQVTVVGVDTDRYGRLVAEVRMRNGRTLNAALVEAGMAWWYRQYALNDAALAAREAAAQRERRERWADRQPVAPWDYRREGHGGATVVQHEHGSRTDAGSRVIHTGPRGGKFYYTDHGTKVYEPRK
jgi:endonuclease YncB( thermonuclease family)